MLAFIPVVLAASPVEVDAGLLARVGDHVDGAAVVAVLQHPEFERYTLERDGASLVVELALADPVHAGLCAERGLALYPRPELVTGALAGIDVASWCARLGAAAEAGRIARVAGRPVAGVATPGPLPGSRAEDARPVQALAVVAAACVVAMFARLPAALGAVMLALVVRLWAVAPGTFNGAGAQFEKLLIALGQMRGAPYGPGYAGIVGCIATDVSSVFTINLVLSSITVGIGYMLIHGETGSRWAAWTGALALAVAPPALALSRSEAMHVLAVAAGLAAVALASASRRDTGRWRWFLGLGAGAAAAVAACTRPDLLLAFPAAAVFAAGPGGSVALGGLALALAWRASVLVGNGVAGPADGALLRVDDYLQLSTWTHGLLPRWSADQSGGGFLAFLDVEFVCPLWWVCVLFALGARGHRGPGARALAWAALATLPFLPKSWPLADALRLQLFGITAACVAVGIGAGALRWRGLLLVAVGLLWVPRARLGWATHQEWAFLAETVPDLPAGTVVQASAYGHRNESFRRVMELLGPATWVSDGEADFVYRGIGEPPPGGEPFAVRRFEVRGDLDVSAPPGGVEVGLYAVRGE